MDEPPTFVIGQEMAAAIEADCRRIGGSGSTSSPLPPAGDDPWSGRRGRFRITPAPHDEALTAFRQAYRMLDRRPAARRAPAPDLVERCSRSGGSRGRLEAAVREVLVR